MYAISTNVAGLVTTYNVPLRDDCNIFWYRSPGSSTSFKNLGLPSFPGFIPERHKHRPFQALTLSPPFLRFSLPSPQTVNTITFSPSIHAHSVPTLKTLLLFFGSRCPNCSSADRASVPPSYSLLPRVFSSTLKMEAGHASEKSADFYQTTRVHITGHRYLHVTPTINTLRKNM